MGRERRSEPTEERPPLVGIVGRVLKKLDLDYAY